MAYSVSGDSPHRARAAVSLRQARSRAPARVAGDRVLTRNALITGAALGCLCFVAAGVALTGRDHRIGSLPGYVASHKAFKAALVEVAQQAQIERPTRFAAQPAPDARMKTARAEIGAELQASSVGKIAHVPLPHARPKQMVVRIPLPRERMRMPETATPGTVLAETAAYPPPQPSPSRGEGVEGAAPTVMTAALDTPAAETEMAPPAAISAEATRESSKQPEPAPQLPPARSIPLMSYAPTRELLFENDLTSSIGNPAREIDSSDPLAPSPRSSPHRGEEDHTQPSPNAATAAPEKADVAAAPAVRKLKAVHEAAAAPVRKPAHRLTVQEKLWGPVRVASLTPFVPATDDTGIPRAPYDRQTAVYVISDKKVYLPDGRVLEAHSGLGDKMDDPRFVHVRMRGATPPHVYDLTLRESLFHGVEAIRMTPIGGERAIFGRDGILAHTYMLGPNGQSNGCVSFKDYDAFLDAFKDGKINRLAVIAKLD
jgi:hypothetical protein